MDRFIQSKTNSQITLNQLSLHAASIQYLIS